MSLKRPQRWLFSVGYRGSAASVRQGLSPCIVFAIHGLGARRTRRVGVCLLLLQAIVVQYFLSSASHHSLGTLASAKLPLFFMRTRRYPHRHAGRCNSTRNRLNSVRRDSKGGAWKRPRGGRDPHVTLWGQVAGRAEEPVVTRRSKCVREGVRAAVRPNERHGRARGTGQAIRPS